MKRKMKNIMLGTTLSFALVVCLHVATVFAAPVNVNLVAESATVTMPGAMVVEMWGLRDTADGSHAAGDWKIPTISAVVGDSLTINLTNNLPDDTASELKKPTSIIIPGQKATEASALVPTWTDDSAGNRVTLTQRVRSFTHEAPNVSQGGGIVDTYEWANLKAGTYLIQSGTHPAVQMQMGLYAVLKVDAAAGEAYSGVTYDNEVTLVFSEIDPVLHNAVATDDYGPTKTVTSTMEYHPTHFLLNGQSYTIGTAPVYVGKPGQSLLLRFLNAGLGIRVPVIQDSYMTLLAEDGYRKPYDFEQYSLVLSPGKTFDAILPSTSAGLIAVYDRTLDLNNADGSKGGMFAQLDVSVLTATSVSLAETAGAGVTFDYTGTASGGSTPYEYEFWFHDPALGWSQAQAYSTSATWNWDPTGLAAGNYRTVVFARSQGSTVAVQSSTLSHVIATLPATSVTLVETTGAGVTFDYTGTASGGSAPYEYEFWFHDPALGWSSPQTWSTNATWNWDPTGLAAGNYRTVVFARSQGSTVAVQSSTLSHVIDALPATSVTLVETAGAGVTFDYTGTASGGSAPYEYEFWFHDPALGWSQAQAYSTSATWNWDPTGLAAGNYRTVVFARSQGSTVAVQSSTLGHVIP